MKHTAGITAIALVAAAASASISVTQGTSAPTYDTTLTFDEPGTPTGTVATNTWAGIGLAEMQAGDSNPFVGDVSGTNPWINSGNAFQGIFGVFMTFDTDLTSFSAQVWDPSGDPGPFGGGVGIFVFNDGVEVANAFITPAWGGLGDEWIDITTAEGMTFDEVRILGYGFFPTTYVDNLSWNAVPAPSSIALLGFAGFTATRRRR
jgi:hypothetical protein